MIKKLKLKFILIMLLMLCILFYCMLAFFYIHTKINLKNDSVDALFEYSKQNSIMMFNDRFDKFFRENDKFARYDVFALEYNSTDNSVSPYGFDKEITDEQKEYIYSLLDCVLAEEDDIGVIEKYNLRYYKTGINDSITKFVFLDKEYEDSTLSDLLITILIIGTAGTVAFAIITLIFSHLAIKPVEKSWKQQQQLIADVSHELKTPLAVISANTDIVISHNEETVDEQRKWLGYIKDETERMSSLISDILYLAKNDEAKERIEKSVFNLSDTVTAAYLPYESVLFEKQLLLEANIQPGIQFFGNQSLITQLVTILIDNAGKYTPPGNTIKLSLCVTPNAVVLAVNNPGDEIPAESLKHLFERFYRVDDSRQNNGSFGLGLSIAKSITELHDGRISVTSDETGNTFICAFKKS